MVLGKYIPKTERILCAVVWPASAVYAIYCFAITSNNYFQHYDDIYSDFNQGWSFLSRKKDRGDFEWRTIKWIIRIQFWWIISAIVVSEIIRYFQHFQLLALWQIVISVAFILKELGATILGVVLFQPLLFYLVLSFTRRKSVVWVISISVLLFMTTFKLQCFNTEECLNFLNLNTRTFYATVMTAFWINLRVVSWSLYIIESKGRALDIKFLAYCLYLPVLISGPVILFEKFQTCYQVGGDLRRRILDLFINIFRFFFWFAVIEFFLHFIYVYAMNFHPETIRSFGLMSLYGFGYTMATFFHVKYLVSYGLAVTFAKFEHVQVPTLPVCIGRIHLYSNMWKYFDAGLYDFLLNCMYIPLRQSGFVKNRLMASFICFIFIYIWHGVQYAVLLWTTLNYIGIVLEYFSRWIYENYLKKMAILKKIGPQLFSRMSCMLAAPLLVMSAISNFYFFAGSEVGDIFVSRVLSAGIQSSIKLYLVMYAFCRVSSETKLPKTTEKQKQK